MPNRLYEASDRFEKRIMEANSWCLTLPLHNGKPPLSKNYRLHWAEKARRVKTVREAAGWQARAARIPPQQSVTVRLHYQPRGNWRADPSNLTDTQKAAVDGLRDAGVIRDDTPEFVTELMPVILPAVRGEPAGLWLVVRDW